MRVLLGKALAASALIGISTILFSTAAQAHKLTEIRGKPNSETLRPDIKAAQALARKNKAVIWSAYRIKEIGPLNENEKNEDTILRVIKYSLHRDLPVTGNEDGYDFSILTEPTDSATLQTLMAGLPELADEDSGLGATKLSDLVSHSLEQKLWVYVGRGLGEKTSAEILAFFDADTAEFVYLVNSNYGLGKPHPKKHPKLN